MAHAFALTRETLADPLDLLRVIMVCGSGLAIIMAG